MCFYMSKNFAEKMTGKTIATMLDNVEAALEPEPPPVPDEAEAGAGAGAGACDDFD